MRNVCVAAVFAVVALVGCGGGDGTGAASELVFELKEQKGSRQDGTATLRAAGDGETRVTLELSNPPAEEQPAHIHPGTCDHLDPSPAYVLTNVRHGKSDTTLQASLDQLRDAELVINVHKSAEEITTYAACGAIP